MASRLHVHGFDDTFFLYLQRKRTDVVANEGGCRSDLSAISARRGDIRLRRFRDWFFATPRFFNTTRSFVVELVSRITPWCGR